MKHIPSWLTLMLISAVALGLFVSPCTAESLSAVEIMRKADARDDGDNMICDRTMLLIDKNGHERTRTMKSFAKDTADVRNTGFLTWDYRKGDRDDDQWLYLSELKKVKRIASADKSGAFMGSDFSYADMTRRVVDEWRYRLIKTDEVRGNACWLIEAVPMNERVKDRYGYKKSLLFVRQDIFMICRAVHWLDEGNKIKYVDMPDIKKIDGIWTALQITAKTTRSGKTLHKTIFTSKNVRYGQAVEEGMFTPRQLEKGL